MNNNNVRTIKTVNRSRKIKKLIVMATTVSIFVACAAITVFAAGNEDASFKTTASKALTNVVTLIGGALGTWGVVNLLEGYGNDNPGAKSQGIKQSVAGVGLIIVGQALIPAMFTGVSMT